MELIHKRLANLLTEKSIVTNAMTLIVAYLAVKEMIPADKIMDAFLIVIGFYFGTQSGKKGGLYG